MEQVEDRIILEGVLQQFERRMNRNNGRIYPEAAAYERLIKRHLRMNKINRMFNEF